MPVSSEPKSFFVSLWIVVFSVLATAGATIAFIVAIFALTVQTGNTANHRACAVSPNLFVCSQLVAEIGSVK